MRRPRLVVASVSALAGLAVLVAACTSADTASEHTASSAAPLAMSDWAIANLAAGDFATWAATPGVQVLTGKFLAPGTSAVDRGRAVDAIALVGGPGWATVPLAHVDGDRVVYTNEAVGTDFNVRAREAGARVLTGDFDSNGRIDIAIIGGVSSTTVHLAFSNGDGTWRMIEGGAPLMANAAAMPGVRPTPGDFDGDGYTDIALLGGVGATYIPVFFSNGDGTFRMQSFPNAFTAYVNAAGAPKLFCADFNGDHKDDLALVGGTGWSFVPVALSNGDGSFRTTTTTIDSFGDWATRLDARGGRVASFTGDFNGDGRADLALAGGNGWATIPIAFSNGDGSFTVRNGGVGDYDAWLNQTAIAPIVRDFDGDHRDDVALVGGAGWSTIPVARSQGDGSFVVQNLGGINVGLFDGWASGYGAKLVTGEFARPGEVAIGLVGGAGWWTVPFAEPRCDGATCPGVFTAQVTTQHNDNARTGANQDEAVLTPANVKKTTFGKLFQWDVVGQVYAQPLYVPSAIEGRDMVYVATEANWIYAFDAKATTASEPKRKIQLGLPVPGHVPLNTKWDHNNIWPLMGVTSTPVVDRRSNTLYVVSAEMTLSGGETSVLTFSEVFRLHALDLDTLADRPNSPVTLIAKSATYTPHSFSPPPYLQRAGLLLSGDQILVAFGSNTGDYTVVDPSQPFYSDRMCPAPGHEHDPGACDCGPKYPVDPAGHCPLDPKMNYVGWVMSYSKKTLGQTGVFVTAPYSLQGGIWQGGNGLVANERGDIYAQTGNGLDPINDYGNSVVRLVRFPRSPGLLPASKFTVPTLGDNDLGSAGPMLIPGTNHLVGGGKDGIVYVLDQDVLGGTTPLWRGTLGDAVHPGAHAIIGSPAYWNGNVYLWGAGDVLRALPVTAGGLLDGLSADGRSSTLTPQRVGSELAYSPKGAFLSISARGNDGGSAIVWANVPSQFEDTTRLVAYDAADVRSPLWTSDVAVDAVDGGGRFAVPTVAGGRVFLGTYKLLATPADHVDGQVEGHVTVFGLLPAPRDASDAGAADSAPACAPAGSDPIDTTWNLSSTSIYPTYFKGVASTDSLGHCAGCHLPGRDGAYRWAYASDDADTFYNALATITPTLMTGPLLVPPTAGDPKRSILGDPTRTPLAWFAPTSGLTPMPYLDGRCDAHAARAITAWLAAGAPK